MRRWTAWLVVLVALTAMATLGLVFGQIVQLCWILGQMEEARGVALMDDQLVAVPA